MLNFQATVVWSIESVFCQHAGGSVVVFGGKSRGLLAWPTPLGLAAMLATTTTTTMEQHMHTSPEQLVLRITLVLV
jgi:hypothetical protein